MSLLDLALGLDASGQPVEAASAYEAVLDAGLGSLEIALNLAVLYWVCTDGGFLAHHGLTQAFVDSSERRSREILDTADQLFGPYNETQFWRYYFDHISYGTPVRLDLSRLLCGEGPSFVPCFHVYAVTKEESIRNKVEALWELVKNPRTERERYIHSVVRSTLRSTTTRGDR